MKRKDFLKKLALATVAGVPLAHTLTSCSKNTNDPAPAQGSGSGSGSPDCLANGTNVSISSNHGHSLTVSKDDVQAGVEKTYDITGSSSHAHTVVITSAHFATLKSGSSITVSSSSSGHSHSVTVGCA